MHDIYLFSIITSTLIVGCITFLLVIFKSFAWALIVFCIYIGCMIYGIELVRLTSCILFNICDISGKFITTHEKRGPCQVCSNETCNRHKYLPYSAKVKIPKEFDLALQQLLDQLLETYVCTWYSNFSMDQAFLQQLRLAIAIATKNLVARLLRMDVATILFQEFVPLMLQHAEDCEKMSRLSEPKEAMQIYLGVKIHPAAYTRHDELDYVRGLVAALMPHILPTIHVSANNQVILREILANWIVLPALDTLADPSNVNALISLSTHQESPLVEYSDTPGIPMLQSWLSSSAFSTCDRLKPSLEEILNNPQLLYMFMQHIKDTGPMNLLQFCLDIDDLSKRMLIPEMSTNAEENFYTDVQSMYSVYLDPDGPEYLYLPLHISIGIQEILKGGPEKIQELRTSRPFYQAHQEAYALLETTCLSSFHHSYQLYHQLCGCLSSDHSKLSSQTVCKANRSDGASEGLQTMYRVEETDCPTRSFSDIKCFSDRYHRDLTAWRVSVPHVDTGGSQPVYMIAVRSVAEAKSWTVLRQDQDFHTLRTRLMVFHGDKELSDSPLPSRRNPNCSTNRQRYEEFLQRLLSKSTLRSSELLYTFLTMPNIKPYFASCNTPDIGIIYQNMAYKLRKERGQHLDRFMSTFLASTSTKYEHTDVGIDLSNIKSLAELDKKGRVLLDRVFGNNLGIKSVVLPSEKERSQVKGACFCTVDAMDRLLTIPPILSRFCWMFASLARDRIDPMVGAAFHHFLKKLLSGERAAGMVRLLHARITSPRRTVKDPQGGQWDYYENAKDGLHNYLPWCLYIVYAPWCKLTDTVLDTLQHAPLNKHLVYLLLDHLLVNLFPEITV
ncbi:hypothetical protein KM043_016926 [Ampulex compressa]|nr:hypothetical protein KM043_016926 [Ampulex compressa]